MGKVNPFPPPASPTKHDDPAAYVVPLTAFQRPRLYIIGGDEFEWPLGTEGWELSGSATIAEHKYVVDSVVAVQVMHLDSSRIALSGVFPGKTGPLNVQALYRFIRLPNPPDFKRLEIPGIFTQAQQVVAAEWSFTRVEGQPFDMNYNVTFIKVGTSKPLSAPTQSKSANSNLNFSSTAAIPGDDRGTSSNIFVVKQGAQTLRSIASVIYGSPDFWQELYNLNKLILMEVFANVPSTMIATTLIPLGTEIRYV
jgi:hypothetical protein